MLRVDPLAVLTEPDPLRYAARWAAAELIVEAEQEAADKVRARRGGK